MAKLFDYLFGRAKKEEESYQPMTVATPENAPEYVAYCIELEQTVSALEENLHTSDDPKEIVKVACSFYGGDWAGILEVDLDMDVWNPLWWFSMDKRDKTH